MALKELSLAGVVGCRQEALTTPSVIAPNDTCQLEGTLMLAGGWFASQQMARAVPLLLVLRELWRPLERETYVGIEIVMTLAINPKTLPNVNKIV
ncbi:hypothetical protein E2C01_020102 [Portunus trituberculatus]|uniref:Uncharacterized protein n=1 Tax=Portunus trituberculatus TaxID=210409 RepID=A0A5B7DZA8_PORTR|nr:hypothetical protein [Portunus trituberculatus]